MRKRKSSAVSKRSIFAGAVCLCLLIGAAVIQQNWGKQGHEAGQEQSAETAVLEDKKKESAETADMEHMEEPSAKASEQKEPGEQEVTKPDSDASENSETSAPAQSSSRILELADIQAMAAGEILDVSALSREFLDSLFYSQEISEELRQRIWGSSYQENNHISLSELRYLRVLHAGFDGETHIGELIVNQSIAEDILEIMSELYRQNYPIEKMLLIDEYGADDESSMSDNNTSAFNYREIAGSSKLSRHALGLAVDINPRYNPYVKQKAGEVLVSPANGGAYADRSQEFPYKITEGDLCLQLFSEYGFQWGGYWNSVKDYQHFEK